MKADDLINQIHSCGAQNTLGMVRYYQQYLGQLLSAFQVTWIPTYKGEFGRGMWYTGLMDEWKIVDVIFPVHVSMELSEVIKDYYKEARKEGIDPHMKLTVKEAGTTRVHRVGDAVSPKKWDSHWGKQRLIKMGIGERMVGIFNLNEQTESVFLVDRKIGETGFSKKDAKLFLQALIDFPRLHYWLCLERGLLNPVIRPFSPRLQSIVKLLLGPDSEQEIAVKLKLTKGTTHNYISDIYKNLSVSSRHEMVQLWLQDTSNSPKS